MPVANFITIHPPVVETFHSKPQNVNVMVAQEEKSEDHQIIRIHTLGTTYGKQIKIRLL